MTPDVVQQHTPAFLGVRRCEDKTAARPPCALINAASRAAATRVRDKARARAADGAKFQHRALRFSMVGQAAVFAAWNYPPPCGIASTRISWLWMDAAHDTRRMGIGKPAQRPVIKEIAGWTSIIADPGTDYRGHTLHSDTLEISICPSPDISERAEGPAFCSIDALWHHAGVRHDRL